VNRGRVVLAVAALSLSGCAGTALMQSARTLPKGEVDVTVGVGLLHNEMAEGRGYALSNIPIQVGIRGGLTDQFEIGARSLMTLGLLIDAKYDLLPASSPLALSLMGSAGGALFPGQSALHAPVAALASYDVGPVTPYGSLGYGAWWFFYDADRVPGVRYASRTGTGDGTLDLRLGVELRLRGGVTVIAEYSYLRPVVDDPGDFYALASNHLVATGVRF